MLVSLHFDRISWKLLQIMREWLFLTTTSKIYTDMLKSDDKSKPSNVIYTYFSL